MVKYLRKFSKNLNYAEIMQFILSYFFLSWLFILKHIQLFGKLLDFMQAALIVNIYKRVTTCSPIHAQHPSFNNNIMYEGEVHYATRELKIGIYLNISSTKQCILTFMSGFTEFVTILQSINDPSQKIIPSDDSAALLSKK